MYINRSGLLNIANVSGIGSMRLRALIAAFKSPEVIFQASQRELLQVSGIDLKTAQSIKSYSDFRFGEDQLVKLEKIGGKLITFWDPEYPDCLRKINDPPVILFLLGALKHDDAVAVSMVGTRRPTTYGHIVTEKLTRELVGLGFSIVSGLARGVDTIAHTVAINHGGRTIAVIGSGLDVIYPSENRELFYRIAEHGAILSEYPLGSSPDAVNFPKRNRIIAALSLGTIITEADFKSGAIITANFALDYNKEVFCVPGNITSNKSRGCNQLIKEGAKLVVDVNDILEELSPRLDYTLNNIKAVDKIEGLTSAQKLVLESLSDDKPIHIDILARTLNLTTNNLLADLLVLEFENLVKQLPGKMFVRL